MFQQGHQLLYLLSIQFLQNYHVLNVQSSTGLVCSEQYHSNQISIRAHYLVKHCDLTALQNNMINYRYSDFHSKGCSNDALYLVPHKIDVTYTRSNSPAKICRLGDCTHSALCFKCLHFCIRSVCIGHYVTNDTSHFFHLLQLPLTFGMIHACIIAEVKRGLQVGNVE